VRRAATKLRLRVLEGVTHAERSWDGPRREDAGMVRSPDQPSVRFRTDCERAVVHTAVRSRRALDCTEFGACASPSRSGRHRMT
jgi:hypothetical protein